MKMFATCALLVAIVLLYLSAGIVPIAALILVALIALVFIKTASQGRDCCQTSSSKSNCCSSKEEL